MTNAKKRLVQSDILLTLILAIFLAMSFTSHAQTFAYSASTGLRLGGGFDPYDLTKPHPPCLKESKEIAVDGLNGKAVTPEIRFFVKQVSDRRELDSLLSQSISIAGHYEMFSADASYSQQDEVHSASESISWVFGVTARYGKYRLASVELNTEAEHLAGSNLQSLVSRCGSSIVLQVTRGVSAAAIITIQSNSKSERKTTDAELNAAVGGDVFGVNVSATSSSDLKTALSKGEASIQVQAVGGLGAPGLSQLINRLKDTSTIEAVKSTLSDYVNGLGPDEAVPLEYQTTNLSDLVPDLALPDFQDYQSLIGEYYLAYQSNQYWNGRLLAFLTSSTDYVSGDDAVIKARRALENIRQNFTGIRQAANACRTTFSSVLSQALSQQNRAIHSATPRRDTDGLRYIEALNSRALQEVSLSRAQITIPGQLNHLATQVVSLTPPQEVISALTLLKTNISIPSTASNCRFDPAWINFSTVPELEQYPFSIETWSNALDQAPSIFLYLKVSNNTKVVRVEIVNGVSGADLLVLPQNASDNTWVGMIDLTQFSDAKLVQAIVTMKSGKTYVIVLTK